jgi:hypothetical protein
MTGWRRFELVVLVEKEKKRPDARSISCSEKGGRGPCIAWRELRQFALDGEW